MDNFIFIKPNEMKWHRRMMDEARSKSSWSKDRSTKVGCVIVNDDRQIVTTGYNGFPRRIDDDIESRHERPLKYSYTEHAERNAIYQAAKLGHSIQGCTMYTLLTPCIDCARGIIQSGIKRLVTYGMDNDEQQDVIDRWRESFRLSQEMLQEAGVEVILISNDKKPDTD